MSSLFSDRESGSDLEASQRNLSLSDLALQKLQSKLKLLTSTETISLADSFIGDGGCQVLAKFVREHPGVTTLDLRGNNIGAEGLKAIAGLLKPPTSIGTLSLEWNNAHLGLTPLAEVLSTNTTLKSLDLRNNKIGPEAAAQLAASLSTNKTLQRLDLRWNELGQEGVKPFISLLETRQSSLQQLELSGNKAPEDMIKLVEAMLRGDPPAVDEEEAGSVSTPRRRLEAVPAASHSRNRSSGSYRRKEGEASSGLTHTRLETQIADMEFVLEQERKRNADLVSALATEQSLRNESEIRCAALQEAMEQLQASFDEEKHEIEDLLEEEKKHRSEVTEELGRLQDMYARQQLLAQAQVRDVEVKFIEQQKALEQAEGQLGNLLNSRARDQNEAFGSLKSELESQIRQKDMEIGRLQTFKESAFLENKSLKNQIIQVQEQCKQSLTALETQLRDDESRRFNATFHSLDQKLKSVQDLRDSLIAKSQDLQRDLMRAEKKSVEASLAFELEREKLLDQIRELNNQLREYQADVTSYSNQVVSLKSSLTKVDGENLDLKQTLSDQSASFQLTLGEMMNDQRKEREQWEQQRSSTLHRIQALESELILTNAEKRRALDEYLTLGNEVKLGVSKAVQDAIKQHLASLDSGGS